MEQETQKKSWAVTTKPVQVQIKDPLTLYVLGEAIKKEYCPVACNMTDPASVKEGGLILNQPKLRFSSSFSLEYEKVLEQFFKDNNMDYTKTGGDKNSGESTNYFFGDIDSMRKLAVLGFQFSEAPLLLNMEAQLRGMQQGWNPAPFK